MVEGNAICWMDSVSKVWKSGILIEKIHVVGEAETEIYGDVGVGDYRQVGDFEDVDYWEWQVNGDDGKTYSLPESDLVLVEKKL